MKKAWIACFLTAGLLLSGCGKNASAAAVDNGPVTLGACVEVEPMEGWVLQRNEDVLAAEGMYYAQWSSGEESTYENEDGTKVTTHDGEIHLVIVESEDAKVIENNVRQWEALTQQRYPDRETEVAEYGGQAFTVDTYQTSHGRCASAAGVRQGLAIRVDVTVLEGFRLAPDALLEQFLSALHYTA